MAKNKGFNPASIKPNGTAELDHIVSTPGPIKGKTIFYQQEIEHEFGKVLVVLDDETGQKTTQFAQSLEITRGIPVETNAATMAALFYASMGYTPEAAIAAADKYYDRQRAIAREQAFTVAILRYTKFDGPLPEADPVDNEERAEDGLPPLEPPNLANPIEKKLAYVQEMMKRDLTFAARVNKEIQEAFVLVVQEKLFSGEEPEVDGDGFHGVPADGALSEAIDAAGEGQG